jgi:3'-5' exoribonuclease 1
MEPCAEIIEFPVRVIKLGENKFLEDVFHYYVKPRFNDKLTPFCTKLTGISQEVVEKGESLEDVIKKFD